MLKVTTKTTHFVDYSEVGRFIQKCYGLSKRFEITESPNDSDYTYTVTGEALDKYTQLEVEKRITAGNAETYYIKSILDNLCAKGFLPAGTYVMRVSW